MIRAQFIVNPISGTSAKEHLVSLIPQILDSKKFAWDVTYTEYAGHASVLAAEAVQRGVDIVVAVGGDGTVNEIAKSLVHTPTALGIIPCGSGNGLARHLSIPINPEGALRTLNECNIKSLDYGIINDIPFFCTCGIGFDALISGKFAERGKRGMVTYVEQTLNELLKYKPETYTMELDGEEQVYKAFIIACANASQYGNNCYIAPHASMSDGMMDITIMEPFNPIDAPKISIDLFNRTIDQNHRIRTFRCRHCRITRQSPGVIHYDGDPMMAPEVLDIRIVHNDIRMVLSNEDSNFLPPFLDNFVSIYHKMNNEMLNVRNELRNNNRRIRTINKGLLRKLRPNK